MEIIMDKADKQFVSAIADFRGEPIKTIKESITIKDAMDRLKIAMIEEPDYAHTWHCNIAMACYDAMPIAKTNKQNRIDHEIANESATAFMKMCFDAETSNDMLSEDKNK